MKKIQKTPFAIAMSASLLPFASNATEIDANPFVLSDLNSGYMQTAEAEKSGEAKMPEGKCGEGKCGGKMMEQSTDSKAMEGKCAGNKPAPAPSDDKKSEEKK
ncbi:HvfA family oxazolone/thioamide-modified RiPP metallophore [Methylomonas sp. MgM2]